MMKFIDTHAHLYDEAFDGDFDETIARIKGNGVVKCIFPAIDSTTFARQRDAAAKCGDFVAQAMGQTATLSSLGQATQHQAAAFFSLWQACGECLWSWLESSCNHRPQEATPDNTLGRGNVASQTILSNLPHQPTLQSIVKGPGVAGELHKLAEIRR